MSSVQVILDTRPPRLTFEADAEVSPPGVWSVLVRADEEIGNARFDFLDGAGIARGVGYDLVDAQTLNLLIPTQDLATGSGTLQGWVGDLACNQTVVALSVFVRRPRAYEVLLELGKAYEVDGSVDHVYDVVGFVERPFGVRMTLGDV